MKPQKTSQPTPVVGNWLLDPAEWDFRTVTKKEFAHAAWYEYARSCPLVCSEWSNWLKTALELKHMNGRYSETLIANFFQEFYPNGLPAERNTWGDNASMIAFSFPKRLQQLGLAEMLLRMPKFPAPWISLDSDAKAAFLEVTIGRSRPRAFYEAFGPQTGEECRFTVGIDFRREVPAIKQAFVQWLEEKCKLLDTGKLTKIKTQTGKAAIPNYEALKWLAAYRFKQSGITHPVGQEMVQRRIKQQRINEFVCGLPDYKSSKNRSRAIGLAKIKLVALCSPPCSRFAPAGTSPFA